MIYNPASETVSLAGSGAELTSVKKGSLAFDEKADLSSDPSSDLRDLQNPLYVTSQFNTVPRLTEDRTLYNPVYETVTSDPVGGQQDNNLPEKILPSPEDFLAPVDPQPLLDITTDTETTEKVIPSPDDFMVPSDDTKPLVATTTATGTTTVHANGEKYAPATPVPIEVEKEPQYATVIPKHKRATAKPFAADKEESDDD